MSFKCQIIFFQLPTTNNQGCVSQTLTIGDSLGTLSINNFLYTNLSVFVYPKVFLQPAGSRA